MERAERMAERKLAKKRKATQEIVGDEADVSFLRELETRGSLTTQGPTAFAGSHAQTTLHQGLSICMG